LTEKAQILKSTSVITLATLTSRILGYIRDQRVAQLLGTTLSSDAFYLAFRIPNLLRRLVAEGAMSAAFVPVFTTYLVEKSESLGDCNRRARHDFLSRVDPRVHLDGPQHGRIE
jgi:peptidoglycan biosynthesis protein MviN/MurJ (putative lipid II flippase)